MLYTTNNSTYILGPVHIYNVSTYTVCMCIGVEPCCGNTIVNYVYVAVVFIGLYLLLFNYIGGGLPHSPTSYCPLLLKPVY